MRSPLSGTIEVCCTVNAPEGWLLNAEQSTGPDLSLDGCAEAVSETVGRAWSETEKCNLSSYERGKKHN